MISDSTANVRSLRWVVVGGSGFIGASIVAELRELGAIVNPITAPRLQIAASSSPAEIVSAAKRYQSIEDDLVKAFRDADIIVNAAGMAVPDAVSSAELFGANALLPIVLANATARVSARRVIHLSSAAVQGRRLTLDESAEVEPFSPYSASKALGEASLAVWHAHAGSGSVPDVVVLRATSVQGDRRRSTVQLRHIARSAAASVASPGSQPTPITSVAGLVDFVMQVGVYSGNTPPIVLQPSEGMTTIEVLKIAGGKDPLILPRAMCALAVRLGYLLSKGVGGRFHGLVRRVELMWFGQEQNAAWSREQGLSVTNDVARVLAGSIPLRRERNGGSA